jgi:hypothetical protein
MTKERAKCSSIAKWHGALLVIGNIYIQIGVLISLVYFLARLHADDA